MVCSIQSVALPLMNLQKSEQIHKVVEAVAEDTGMDVAFLRISTHPEYLSDEVSGPESDSETPEDWKFRLATLANLRNDPTSLKATQILEVLVPGWRDEQVFQSFISPSIQLSNP